jgi:hypothetical protein
MVRSLDLPGDRVVMLADKEGNLHFSGDTGGSLFRPSVRVPQSDLRYLFDRASNSSDKSLHVPASVGLEYLRMKAYSNIVYSAAICGGSLMVVATKGKDEVNGWGESSIQGCSSCHGDFPAADSLGKCKKCWSHRCPSCRGCDCKSTDANCSDCNIILPVSARGRGQSKCDNCG